MSDGGEAYLVGRGRPPLHSRFAPGKSGNPRGRPKGRKSSATILDELLSRKVAVGEGRNRRSMTMEEVMIRRICQKAANGELKYVELVLRLKQMQGGAEEQPAVSSAEDDLIFQRFLEKNGWSDDGAA
ncbi:DUF5681 domain-containing protein [Bosea sp. (in: a-proteobacteria)]|uniref:DUF5681 domain-containing protein n=1 Tax=Bosea sp. (in: a-proteobacteria) TaxID=1871050 RepID=UPI00262953E8|nr:DUF5681 domain-containing protein [Bosea sp. (in: a-proteobacteria)]MCO5091726.1 DUF5681 domain-containing protein [Bosea sp. (in: a-proteobacteria)]